MLIQSPVIEVTAENTNAFTSLKTQKMRSMGSIKRDRHIQEGYKQKRVQKLPFTQALSPVTNVCVCVVFYYYSFLFSGHVIPCLVGCRWLKYTYGINMEYNTSGTKKVEKTAISGICVSPSLNMRQRDNIQHPL